MSERTPVASKKPAKDKQEQPVEQPLRVGSVFKTDIGFYDCMELEGWAEYNAQIRTSMLRERIEDPDGLYRSNMSGTWHSKDRVLSIKGMERFRDMLGKQFRSYVSTWGAKENDELKLKLQSWAMMYTHGGYATIHTHPNCHASSVYFCDDCPSEELTMATGEGVAPGELEFFDTRANVQLQVPHLNTMRPFRVKPKAGLLLVFPSWLPHFVHPVTGDQERISIATNMTVASLTKGKDNGT